MQKRISIIIPVFNSAKTLRRCLDSIVHQSFSDWELIVIDGRSTDESLSIIEDYRSHIHFALSEKDAGVYDAINKGIDHATGKWIYILGSDDQLHSKDTLERIFQGVYTTECLVGDIVNTAIEHRGIPERHSSYFSSALYWKNTVHQQGVMYLRKLFDDFRFDTSLKVLGDYALHIRLYRQCVGATRVPIIFAKCDAQGLSKQFEAALYKEELRMKRQVLPFHLYLLNIVWVRLKFLRKKLIR